jgi:hypothetical protein
MVRVEHQFQSWGEHGFLFFGRELSQHGSYSFRPGFRGEMPISGHPIAGRIVIRSNTAMC